MAVRGFWRLNSTKLLWHSLQFVTVLFFASNVDGQESAGQQAPIDRGLDFVSESMKKDVKERVEKSLADYRKNLKTLEPQIRKFMKENDRVESIDSFNIKSRKEGSGTDNLANVKFPRKHPLLESDGVADTSKEDYTKKDTEVMLNTETFGQCLEERQVTSGPYVEECKKRCNPGWVTYDAASAANSCHSCLPSDIGTDKCRYNQLYVSELYWPVYQSRTYPARAMGSFDPNGSYLSGEDKQQSLEYNKVREESYDRYVKYLQDFYKKQYETDISEDDIKKAFPEELYTMSDYSGRDLNVEGLDLSDTQPEHSLVYMTNTNRQLSRRFRPGKQNNWKGYVTEDKCFFNTLPDPDKLAVSHATYNEGHDELTFAYNHQKINELNEMGPTRGSPYGHAMLDEGPEIKKLITTLDKEWRADPKHQPKTTINSMLGQYIEMKQSYYGKGLERVGTEKADHWQDWLYHNFFRLYHSRNKENLEDPLYAGIVSGFSFYTLNALKNYNPNMSDDGKRRPIAWSFWAGRPGRDGDNYAGDEKVGPGKIFSVDKIQVIYPTVDDGKKGSHCFKPESLAKSEYMDPNKNSDKIAAKVGTQEFYGFRRDLDKRLLEKGIEDAHNYVREVRVAYWIKRVNCHCTVCAQKGFLGCSVLNTGDHPEDWFYGTKSIEIDDPDLYPPTNEMIRFAKVSVDGFRVSKGAAPKGDFVVAANSEETDQLLYRVNDLSEFGGVSNKIDYFPKRTRNAKEQEDGIEVNARKAALGSYGGHAKDADAAEPKDEGGGDKYEEGPQSEIGTPGPAPAAQDDPLAGNDSANETPANFNPPATFAPPPILNLPLLCPNDDKDSQENANQCQAKRLVLRCSSGGCSGSGDSSGSGSGGCGGGGEGKEEESKAEEILQQIAGQLLGQLLGNLLSGGQGGQSSQQSSSSSSASSSSSTSSSFFSGSSGSSSSSTNLAALAMQLGESNSSAQLTSADSPREELALGRAIKRLQPKFRKAFASRNKEIELPLRQYRYEASVDQFTINGYEYRITRPKGDSFGCIGSVCDHSLGRKESNPIGLGKAAERHRFCRRKVSNDQTFECWSDKAGLIVLGRELLKSSFNDQERAQIFSTALGYSSTIDPRTVSSIKSSVRSNQQASAPARGFQNRARLKDRLELDNPFASNTTFGFNTGSTGPKTCNRADGSCGGGTPKPNTSNQPVNNPTQGVPGEAPTVCSAGGNQENGNPDEQQGDPG